jgi:hypothetical protein
MNKHQLTPLLFLILSFLIIQCSSTKNAGKQEANSADTAYTETSEVEEMAEESDYIEEDYLRYEDHIYKKNIRSAMLYVEDQPLSFPVLFLRGNKRLQLHFDDMDSDFQTYSYKFIHCNANWEPSGLTQQEYINGFFNSFIDEYNYSFNTLFSYLHYQLEFPNQDIQFSKSGNYILMVFANNDEEDVVLTRRFFVVDNRIDIRPKIHMATLAKFRDYKQEIDFTINTGSYLIQDPYSDLKVVISQNRRWDNAITDLKPLFVRTPELIYNYEDKNLFDGNNEYRFFDTKDLRYQSMNIDGIQIMNGKTHVYVLPEEPRSFKRYYFQQDINGKRLIKRDESVNSNKEADYMLTHFTLKRENPVLDGDVYVFGQLSDWQFKEAFKMEYVAVNKEYTLTTTLKQGYYNYNYVVLPKNSTQGDMSIIEGTHSETENEYYFFVYHRQQGEIYDRLIGFNTRNSNQAIDE